MYPYYVKMTEKELTTINSFDKDEEFIIHSLKTVLDNLNLADLCSFFGYAENKLCLNKRNHLYVVYQGERNIMYEPFDTYDIKEACLEMIYRIAGSQSECEKITKLFTKNISVM